MWIFRTSKRRRDVKASDVDVALGKLSAEEKLRKHCLEQAVRMGELGAAPDYILDCAMKFENYIKKGEKK